MIKRAQPQEVKRDACERRDWQWDGTDEDHNAILVCAHRRASSFLSREVCMISQNKAILPINISEIKPSLYHKSWFPSAQGIG